LQHSEDPLEKVSRRETCGMRTELGPDADLVAEFFLKKELIRKQGKAFAALRKQTLAILDGFGIPLR